MRQMDTATTFAGVSIPILLLIIYGRKWQYFPLPDKLAAIKLYDYLRKESIHYKYKNELIAIDRLNLSNASDILTRLERYRQWRSEEEKQARLNM